MDCSLPGSSVHGISQARILEWVAILFSRGSFWPRDQTRVSCIGRRILYCWATREVVFPYPPLWTNQSNICWANEWAIDPSIIKILSCDDSSLRMDVLCLPAVNPLDASSPSSPVGLDAQNDSGHCQRSPWVERGGQNLLHWKTVGWKNRRVNNHQIGGDKRKRSRMRAKGAKGSSSRLLRGR